MQVTLKKEKKKSKFLILPLHGKITTLPLTKIRNKSVPPLPSIKQHFPQKHMKEDGGHRNRNITNYIAGLRITQLCLWSMSSEESKIFFFL